jgi:glutaminyl-tRNA synthetase
MSNEPNHPSPESAPAAHHHFIHQIIAEHQQTGQYGGRVGTRFPPEPNGYLHIGHAKSICLNFGLAREFKGTCNLRMDDTNPTREDVEYVESIQQDVAWLIGGWADSFLALKKAGDQSGTGVLAKDQAGAKLEPFYASDYFDQIYAFAVDLIKRGKAYICDLSPEDTEKYRGSPDRPGQNSPFRERSIEENLNLFERMRAGEFPDGTRTLRAIIDMSSPNIWLRDPVLYRIRHAEHHQTGKKWCIYPMYDFAHCLSDYIEGITHSICTLEFEVHRPLYDWILEQLQLPRTLPKQYEFARLNLGYTVMSKRKLLQLVQDRVVTGWDDPRMPTISGLRRRGYTPESIRRFCEMIGITKFNGITDPSVLEFAIREDLNKRAIRAMAVLRPLKVTIENYPEGQVEWLEAVNNPEDASAGTRKIPFSKTIYIEQEDFMEHPAKKFFRLYPGNEVRLRYAYILMCVGVVKDAAGKVVELRCTIDPTSKAGDATAGRKVKATIHWASAAHAYQAEVRLYDRLFSVEQPDGQHGKDFKGFLNPASLEVLANCQLEPSLREAKPGTPIQFERLGYFCADVKDSQPGAPVFNRTVPMKDNWAKELKKG